MNGDTLWVWCYPSVASDFRQVLLSKCCLTQDSREFHVFVFGQFCRTWYYITTVEVQEPTALTKVKNAKYSTAAEQQLIVLLCALTFFLIFLFVKVTHFSVVITAKDFNPEKYAALTRILGRSVSTPFVQFYFKMISSCKRYKICFSSRMYVKHGSPVKMMEAYVTVLTKGLCQTDENGSFLIKDYDIRKAYLAGSIKGETL